MTGTWVYEWHPYIMVEGMNTGKTIPNPLDHGVGVPFINPCATDVNAPGTNDLQHSYVNAPGTNDLQHSYMDAVGSNEDQHR
jgi:hypothetical protein